MDRTTLKPKEEKKVFTTHSVTLLYGYDCQLIIDESIKITLFEVQGNTIVRLNIEAPEGINIRRE